MREELTISREDYLKAIIEAESEGHSVVPVLLAQWLNVSPPAVSKALRRLREDGYVSASSEGSLELTDKGRTVAQRTALRHHLVERMLSEIFGMPWHQIHTEAERLEHAISPEFEQRLIAKLGTEGECPHGNGILPETPAQIKRRGLVKLSDANEGAMYAVARLYERDAKLLEFFHKLGLGPGVNVRLIEHNYDNTFVIDLGKGRQIIGESAANRIWVKPAGRTSKH